MDSDDFLSACATAAAGLLNLTPFTSTKTWLSAYASFTPSSSAGPTGPTAGATPFGSTLDPSTNTLSIDSTAVFNYVGDLVSQGNWPSTTDSSGAFGSTIIVLLPAEVTGQPIVAEMESRGATPGQGADFAATTSDGYCQQLIGRVIASLIGLGDEFELGGASNQRPSDPTPLLGYPNLYCSNTPPQQGTPAPQMLPWYAYLTGTQQSSGLTVVPHPGSPSTADTQLYEYATPLQLVEGGGGYQTQVYRSNPDCIMRRQIGNAALPVKDPAVAFCPVCEKFLRASLRLSGR